MKSKINSQLPLHNITTHSNNELYIADYKDATGGDVVILDGAPTDIKYVFLLNPKQINICFDGFKDNALPLSRGNHNKQCECVLFPNRSDENNWILFIETKYANNIRAAFKQERDYPNCMVNQIIKTVEYFRDKGIINLNKKVHAIVSFPKLISDFDSTLFQRSDLSPIDILTDHKIIIRGTNSANIISEKRIRLHTNN